MTGEGRMKAGAVRRPGAGWWRWPALALAAIAVLWCALHWSAWRARAELAAGFGARIACSCRYIEGRDIKSCKTDFAGLKGMWAVRLADDAEGKTLHASIPLLAARAAQYRPGFGCMIDTP